MIDTIKLLLEKLETDNLDILHNIMEHYNHKTKIITWTGNLNNLRISQHHRGITIEGSFPKYYYGDNVYPMSFDTVALVIDSISEKLNVDCSNSKILRLDLVLDISLSHKPADYLPALDELPRCTKYVIDDLTVLFKNTVRELVFYDKKQQILADRNKRVNMRNKIHVDDLPRNLLRYEYRMKKIKDIINSNLYVKDLNNLALREKLVTLPKHNYLKIVKKPLKSPLFCIPEGYDIYKTLAMYGITAVGGTSAIYSEIDNLYYQQRVQKAKRWRWKKAIRDLTRRLNTITNDELLTELDSKVDDATELALIEQCQSLHQK